VSNLADRYPDLLAGEEDAALERAVAALDRTYRAALPPRVGASMDRVLRARMTLTPAARPPSRPRAVRARRPLGLAAALVAAVVVAGAYAAIASLGDQALQQNPGTRQIAARGLAQPLNLSRSACGFTVTLNRVYADAQRIVLAYTVTGPTGRSLMLGTSPGLPDAYPILSPAPGEQFLMGGVTVLGDTVEVIMGHATGQIVSYDARRVVVPGAIRPYHMGPGPLALRFTIPAINLNETGRGAWPATPACERHSPTTGYPATTIYRGVWVKGPFTYAITALVAPSREVALHQVARVGATAITLTGLQLTPSNTRFYLRVSGQELPIAPPRGMLSPVDLSLTASGAGLCPTGDVVVYGGHAACREFLAPVSPIVPPRAAAYSYTVDFPFPINGNGRGRGATLAVYTRLRHGRYADPVTFQVSIPRLTR